MVASVQGRPAGGGRLARVALVLALPLVCAAMIVGFALALFPYERFRGAAEQQLGALVGAQAQIAELSGGISIGGPALDARGVQLRWPDGEVLEVERVRARPAWALSWLRGQPALAVDLSAPLGRLNGTFWLGDRFAFRGKLHAVQLGDLPPGLIGGPSPLQGSADADVSLRLEAGSPRGTLQIVAEQGSLAPAELPMAIPFERLVATARFGEAGAIELADVALYGPMLAATGGGSIGSAPRLALAPLDLDMELEVVDANLRPAVRSWGVRIDSEGRARLRVTGSMSRPVLR